MTSSLAKVMGLQSRPSKTLIDIHVEHGSRHRKDIQHDRRGSISHSGFYL